MMIILLGAPSFTGVKSPEKTDKPCDESVGEEELYQEEECSTIFEPVIPLPDKVIVLEV